MTAQQYTPCVDKPWQNHRSTVSIQENLLEEECAIFRDKNWVQTNRTYPKMMVTTGCKQLLASPIANGIKRTDENDSCPCRTGVVSHGVSRNHGVSETFASTFYPTTHHTQGLHNQSWLWSSRSDGFILNMTNKFCIFPAPKSWPVSEKGPRSTLGDSRSQIGCLFVEGTSRGAPGIGIGKVNITPTIRDL